ncbi:MAG TPA: helix-turn-helix transcriptional regulator, partial [Caulobacter sp.]|nr:helix-turn-helix transcriptional regulator [Caulobacter sp.]
GKPSGAGRAGVRAARLRAIKQHIGENLHNPRLSAETAGRRLDISPRYVRRLFAAEGRSFSDYVTERRLAAVRQRLSDPRFADRPIAEIAFEAGLVEPSTFYRQFKARYGAKPSEIRLG